MAGWVAVMIPIMLLAKGLEIRNASKRHAAQEKEAQELMRNIQGALETQSRCLADICQLLADIREPSDEGNRGSNDDLANLLRRATETDDPS